LDIFSGLISTEKQSLVIPAKAGAPDAAPALGW